MPTRTLSRTSRLLASAGVVSVLAAACTGSPQRSSSPPTASRQQSPVPSESPSPTAAPSASPDAVPPDAGPTDSPSRKVTLGFAGDVHFAGKLQTLLDSPDTALSTIASALGRPDLMMVNLETAITDRGSPFPKEFHFRTSPLALDALAASGVDVVTMANNHAVDYGAQGLRDTLFAVRRSPIPVVGIGASASAAFRPYLVSVRGTRIAVLAATTLPDETAAAWAAGPTRAGVAVALLPRELVPAVRAAKERADVVVVYLHWGDENQSCPYWRPLLHARVLAAAGADVIVGSHAHVLLGAGWLGSAYVDYGLGNFVWYNQTTVQTGLLTLTVRDGGVVDDAFAPADIGAEGLPRVVRGRARASAVAAWRDLRGCTNLAAQPSN